MTFNFTACVQHVAPRCEWLSVMAVGRAGRDYNLCLYYRVEPGLKIKCAVSPAWTENNVYHSAFSESPQTLVHHFCTLSVYSIFEEHVTSL